MLSEIEKLLVLQDRDLQINRLHKELERIPREITQARARLESDEKAVGDSKAKLQENEMAIKNLELDIGTRRQTVSRLKTQQFETRKNEEFQALSHEIDRYGTEIDKLEDRELELMEAADALRDNLGSAEGKLKKTKALVAEDLEELEKKRKAAEQRIADIRSDRDRLGEEVDEAVRSLYERILKKKGDTAVVDLDLDSGICQGCHMKVTTATLHKVKAEREITQCENCGRMLYPGG